MKRLIDILREECATPGNTVGMGNPMPAGEGVPGSEPLVTAKAKKEKKKKNKTEEE